MRKFQFFILSIIIASLVGCSNSDNRATSEKCSSNTYTTTNKDNVTTSMEAASDEETTIDETTAETTTEIQTTTIADVPTTTIQPLTTTYQQPQTPAPTQPQQVTTEKQFVCFEESTNANHEGQAWVLWSDGSKTDFDDIVYRRDLAEQLFSKLLELRRNEYQSYGFPEECVATHWSEEVYELCKQRCVDIMDNFSHQGKPDFFGENLLYSFLLIDEDNAQSAFESWYNSKGHHYNLVIGGLSKREAVAAYQYGDVIYWVYLYGN